MPRRTKADIEAELEIALIDRDQKDAELDQWRERFVGLEKQFNEAMKELNQLTSPVPQTLVRPWADIDPRMEGVVYEVVLTHYDERYGPPEQPVLRVMMGGGGIIFLEIAEVDAQYVQTRYVPIATFGVEAGILHRALNLVETHG